MSELPNNWVLALLPHIATINPTLDKSCFLDELEVSFVPMPSVEAETGKIDVSQTKTFAEVKKGYTPFRKDDVLFAKITPCMENGKMAVVPKLHNDVGFGSTEFHVLRAKQGIEPQYLYYYVSSKSYRYNAEHNMTGAVGQKRVPTAYLEKSLISLPPTNEQKRIVAKIEELFSELDKGIENLKTAREQLKVYRQAILSEAFEKGDSVRPETISVKDAADKIVDCLHSTPKFSNGGKLCIDSTWIENNKVIWDQARYVPESIYIERVRRLEPQKGDVLFVREGSKKIGTSLVLNFEDDCCLGQRMMMFRLKEHIEPKYFTYYVQSNHFVKQYKPLIGGSASPHLNITDIKNMTLPLYPKASQSRIVNFIESQFSKIDDVEKVLNCELQKSEIFRQSILKRAFSGKLVAQDPKDEPATVLLERIKAERSESPERKKKVA